MTGCVLKMVLALGLTVSATRAQDVDPMMGGAPPPTVATPREGCVTADCHPGVKAARFLHGPVNVNACDSCHTLTNPAEHSFTIARTRRDLCTFCHQIEESTDEFVHEPYAQGECLSCHDPHGSSERVMLRGRNYAESCVQCHGDVSGAHDQVHGPVAAGACGACHEPHSAPHRGLLTLNDRDLCLRCHVAVGEELDSMRFVHDPAAVDCRLCHDPHATDRAGMLQQEPEALCTSCHDDIARIIDGASTQHAAVTTDRSCLNCHSPHASNREAMLRDSAAALCFECHDKEITLEDGRVLKNMKAIIDSGTSLHGPVAQNNCTACHEIHGGGNDRLLTNEYPSSLYYPYSGNAYALCFSCHDRQMVLQEQNDAVTGFRNGKQNLHYVHVNQDERGRSCRVCHDSHASSRDHIIRDSIPYGPAGWKLPIGYTKTENGGTCNGGCHQPFSYDRVSPVKNKKAEDTGAWKGRGLVPPGAEDQEQKE